MRAIIPIYNNSVYNICRSLEAITVFVPIDAQCASADTGVRLYLFFMWLCSIILGSTVTWAYIWVCLHRYWKCTVCTCAPHASMAAPIQAVEIFIWESFISCISGFHVYQDIWQPEIGEEIVCAIEKDNVHDIYVASVLKSVSIVGHVPSYVMGDNRLILMYVA